MAAESRPHHTRADSGVGSMNSISKTLASMQSLWEAMASLTKEDGFQELGNVIKHVPLQEDELRKRDEEIRRLNTGLAAQKQSYEAYNQTQLSHFEGRYHQWKTENEALQNEVEGIKAGSKEKDELMEGLRQNLTDCNTRISNLENTQTKMQKTLDDKELLIKELNKKLETSKTSVSDYQQKLKTAKDHAAALQKSLNCETSEHQSLKNEAEKMRGKLKQFQQFSVRIKELDLPQMTSQLEFLWKSVTTLIGSYFGQDLSADLLRSDWTKLRENRIFKHHIPLPQSNSDVAKQMRVAIILGSVAKLADKFLFQPTHLLAEDSGLREVLRKEATIDPQKELYIRGVLLSISSREQEEYGEESVGFVVDDLLEVVDVQVLLSPETLPTFAGELKDLMSQFQQLWMTIQSGKQKLEPSFAANPTTTDRYWNVLDLKAAVEDSKRPSVPFTTANAQGGTVVIPRIYHIRPETVPDPITNGCVLQKAHMDAASEEIRKGLPSTPFTEGILNRSRTLNRSRNRPGRSLSMTTNGALNGHRNGNISP